VQKIVAALDAQQEELDALLAGLDVDGWASPTRCPGWTVADVVLHLAQTDELAVASAQGRLREVAGRWVDPTQGTVDDAAAAAVAAERGAAPAELLARWRAGVAAQREALLARNPGDRLNWVENDLSARTLATTRLAECWIHAGDVAEAVGAALVPSEHLWQIARLAWVTLPYAFRRAGAAPPGSILLTLDAPAGGTWAFGDDAAATTVTGDAVDFCLLAARRLEPAQARVAAAGPDADAVLALVRTYA
jgi:uncharacterized protein (TIGR03084 family)